jgi:hypothetical protein
VLRSRSTLLLAACALIAAGCGSSKPSTETQSRHGRAGQAPQEIVREMAAALRHVHSYHLEGLVDAPEGPKGTARISADVDRDGDVRMRLTTGRRATLDVIVARSEAFLRASTTYWRQQGYALAARRLQGRWATVPGRAAKALIRSTGGLTPQRLAACARPTPRLQYGGTTTVGGRRAVIIVDRGSPGDSPGAVYVRLRGPALPLRVVQSGRRRPGKPRNPKCAPGRGQFPMEDLRLSHFNADIKVDPPANPLAIG